VIIFAGKKTPTLVSKPSSESNEESHCRLFHISSLGAGCALQKILMKKHTLMLIVPPLLSASRQEDKKE
jgi:hypothetical protein